MFSGNTTRKNFGGVVNDLESRSWNHKNNIENNIVFNIDFDNFLLENLDIREMVILQMMLNGYTQSEIAKHQRVARETINRLISKIKTKFSSFFER